MTKARDLANIISGGFTADDIPNLDASKITSGSLADARIPNLATSKITSGTFADARVSASSVTQHSAPTDLQPIKSDISALALREATNESSAAFNLPNQFIDTFTDDTNLGTQTDVNRTSGYIITATDSWGSSSYNQTDRSSAISYSYSGFTPLGGSNNTSSPYLRRWSDNTTAYDGNGADEDWYFPSGGTINSDKLIKADFGSSYTNKGIDGFRIWGSSSSADCGEWLFQGSNDNANFTTIHTFDWDFNGTSASMGVNYLDINFTNTSVYRYFQFKGVSGTFNPGPYQTEIFWKEKTLSTTTNATGTLIQSANTVGSAKTKVGGTMLYKDNAGTATLGTDLKIYFTCNGGTNWTEASSYSAITPVYSTGIKQVRLGETTCTSGTDVRYKAVWANQAASSKETQLHGIGVNY